jgi:hypothetical protein
MSNAFYVQKPTINISAGDTAGTREVTINTMRLGPGNWVIFAKFEVAVGAAASNDTNPRIIQFGLEFAGQKDFAFCHLEQGGLDTVVLNVASTHAPPLTTLGGPLFVKARLFCTDASHDFEVHHLAMTAISVENLN